MVVLHLTPSLSQHSLFVPVGVKSSNQTVGLEPHIEFDHVQGEGVGPQTESRPNSYGPNSFKRLFEEKHLLERTKYGSNIHPTCNKESLLRVLVIGMSPTSL